MADIPPDILDQIKSTAAKEWPDNREMRDFTVETECASYAEFVALDFDAAEGVREAIVAMAEDYSDSWEERATFCKDQIAAYKELQSIDLSELPDDFAEELLRRAKEESDGDIEQKLSIIKKGVARREEVERIRAEVAPIRDLLVKMEKIIGDECYNQYTRNYGPVGDLRGDGRKNRYPVWFTVNGEEVRHPIRYSDLPEESLLTGRYKFGANELSIFRALVKVVRMLEEEYGLDVSGSQKSSEIAN